MNTYAPTVSASLKPYFTVLIFAITMASCTKDDETISSSESPEKRAAIALYDTYYTPSKTSANDPVWNGEITTCTAGIAAQETRDKILMRIHYFRKASGLDNTLTENASKSSLAMEAALIMHANNDLDHFPADDWKCISEDGKKGAAASLLATVNNAEAIDLYIKDPGSNNGAVGHRRWLCYSKLEEIGIGNTSEYNAIYVLGSAGATSPQTPEFISWPPKGYIPVQFLYDRWSFSLPKANFKESKVTLKNSIGMTIPLTILPVEENRGDNTLVWEPTGIPKAINGDTTYTVTIENIKVGTVMKNFTYDVIFFNLNS